MSEAFFSQFPAANRAAASALPGASGTTDEFVRQPRVPFVALFTCPLGAHEKLVDTRTILISIDGACSGSGTPSARVGVGIFFGPDSPQNISQVIDGLMSVRSRFGMPTVAVARQYGTIIQLGHRTYRKPSGPRKYGTVGKTCSRPQPIPRNNFLVRCLPISSLRPISPLDRVCLVWNLDDVRRRRCELESWTDDFSS
ncbi:hypothetical protein BDZ89DRAFT_1144375 [Hymenopellis radicata]|nr:hypothetical protein BDZ89DRAFT_1144375 [Hymenopellis radicata]